MTKRRTEILETFEKISTKKGVNLSGNYPNYVSRFVGGRKDETMLGGTKIQSTKALSKTGGF